MAELKVAICTPSHGGAYRKHERLISKLFYKTGWPLIPLDDFPSIHIARSIIAEAAIDNGFDVTLWIDSDITFDENLEAARAVVKEAFERKAIVGGLYLGKKFGAPVQARFLPETREFQCYELGSVMEISDIGFGFTAVHTEVFTGTRDKLGLKGLRLNDPNDPKRYTPWFSTELDGEYFHSADFAFTARARRAGYKVFADTRHRIGHLGQHEFCLEDALGGPPRAQSLVVPVLSVSGKPTG